MRSWPQACAVTCFHFAFLQSHLLDSVAAQTCACRARVCRPCTQRSRPRFKPDLAAGPSKRNLSVQRHMRCRGAPDHETCHVTEPLLQFAACGLAEPNSQKSCLPYLW
eukprot:s2973_g2.t1